MSETFLNITEGSGKKFHAWSKTVGANSVLDQVVAIGDQFFASYAVTSVSTATTTADSHLFQLMAGSSLRVRVRRIRVRQFNNAGAATTARLELWRLTTAGSGGSVTTPSPYDPDDAASGATFQALPSAKGTEGNRMAVGSIGLQAASTNQPGEWVWEPAPMAKPLIINPGTTNGIALKLRDGVATSTVQITVEFDESSY